MLADELLFCASIIDGGATRHEQHLANARLLRIAESVRRIEELADGIVAESQSEEHLLSVSERRSQIRVVR